MRLLRVRIVGAAWIILTTAVFSVLMARHAAPFKRPTGLEAAARSLAANSRASHGDRVIAVHILDPRCACSTQVLEQLGKGADPSVEQVVLLLSQPSQALKQKLEQEGVVVRQSSPEEAKREFKLETVPWLVVLGPSLNILYSGGYSPGQIHSAEDLRLHQILSAAKRGESLASLPSFGCVSIEKLRKLLLL